MSILVLLCASNTVLSALYILTPPINFQQPYELLRPYHHFTHGKLKFAQGYTAGKWDLHSGHLILSVCS